MTARHLTDEEIALELEYEDSDIEFEVNDDITDTEDLVEFEKSDSTSDSENEDDGEKLISKHGYEWSTLPIPLSKRRKCNIVTEKSGLRNGSTLVGTIREMFALFISADIVREICEETNRQLRRLSNNKIEQLSEDELYAFIGIMLASGRNHTRKLSLNELWTSEEPFSQPFFTAAMSRDRFINIYSNIRFDNRETRRERFEVSLDKLEPIKSIFSKLVDACKFNYSPSFDITVDERLAAYRGNCPFRVYMKSKPAKYGIKIWVAADAGTAYICNMQIYTGMVNNKREVNQGNRVVMELVERQYGTNRGITSDNFFTSVPLADNLLSKNLTITGTLRKNKREIPKEFLASKERPLHSSLFGFTPNKTLVSYVPQKNKAVLLLSTQFLGNDISQTETKKPEMIIHYNKTKGGVDTGDKMTAEYSCVRSTRRWPFRLFMEMLDIAALNAYLLWIEKYPEWKKNNRSNRKCFIRELSLELAKPNIIRRKDSKVRFHNQQLDAFDTVLSYNQQISTATDATNDNISRNLPGELTNVSESRAPARTCRFCPYDAKKRSTIVCHICKKSVCKSHRKEKKYIFCGNCCTI
jgi:hypothetical protein